MIVRQKVNGYDNYIFTGETGGKTKLTQKKITNKKELRQLQDSDSSSSSSISTAEMFMFVDNFKSKRIRKTTRKNYYSVWRSFNNFYLKLDVKPNNWEDHLTLFVAYLIKSNHQSQTIRSYICAVKAILKLENITIKEDKYLLSSLVRACKLENDQITLHLPIQKKMLHEILKSTSKHFRDQGQCYLEKLYSMIFITAYYGLFRIGELVASEGSHAVKVTDVHIGENKRKFLFVLRSSKTHGRYNKPQLIKIAMMKKKQNLKDQELHPCPYKYLKDFIFIRPKYKNSQEQFFVFADNSHVSDTHIRVLFKKILGLAGFNQNLYSFHGLRSGRSHDLLNCGISIEAIKKLGRWSSNAVYNYLH